MNAAPSPASAAPPASLPLRLAAMVYGAVLLFGVVFIGSYALLALFQWKYPLPQGPRTVLQLVLFVAIGGYFVWCWSRSGQTLALKTWNLKVLADDGAPPRFGLAALLATAIVAVIFIDFMGTAMSKSTRAVEMVRDEAWAEALLECIVADYVFRMNQDSSTALSALRTALNNTAICGLNNPATPGVTTAYIIFRLQRQRGS